MKLCCAYTNDFEDFALAKPTSGTGSDVGCDTDHVTFGEVSVSQFKIITIFIYNYAVILGLGTGVELSTTRLLPSVAWARGSTSTSRLTNFY